MITFIQAIILSIVQGVTEWFPISSSGHLAITNMLLGIKEADVLGFTVYLHFASVLGVIILLWKDIINIIVKKDYIYIAKIAVAVVPVAVAGILLLDHVRDAFSNLFFMGVFFCIFGVLAYSTRYSKEKKEKASYTDSAYIGIAQVFSLFPGISRSGMAIGSGLISGIKREEAIKFSFLIAIPIIFGAAILDAGEITTMDVPLYVSLTTFTITLFISLVTIAYLKKLVKENKFYYFGYYNFVLGIILILWFIFG